MKQNLIAYLPESTFIKITWKRWKHLHSQILILSIDSGYHCNYQLDPYIVYHKNQNICSVSKNERIFINQ